MSHSLDIVGKSMDQDSWLGRYAGVRLRVEFAILSGADRRPCIRLAQDGTFSSS